MVSIVVPIYNSEKTLSACVQSISDQSYSDYELILIDDGSTDCSGQMCDELQDAWKAQGKQCQVIHQSNRGVSAARNCGIEHAKGKFFVCVDSDDLLESCYLEDLVRAAEDHPECGYVLCGFRCTSHVHDYIFSDKEEMSLLDRTQYMLLYDRILIQSPWLALYKTDVVRTQKIKMPEDMSLAEDTLFNLAYLDALEQTAICVVNKPNYIYQNENQSSLYRKYREDLLQNNETVNQTIERYLNKWGVADKDSWDRYYRVVLFNYINVMDNTFHKDDPKTRREKIAYNNMVLQRDLFKKALHNGKRPVSAALWKAMESGNYRRVMFVKQMQKLKRFFVHVE